MFSKIRAASKGLRNASPVVSAAVAAAAVSSSLGAASACAANDEVNAQTHSVVHEAGTPQLIVAEPGLHLVQAQVIFRHGSRTPIHLHHGMQPATSTGLGGWNSVPSLLPGTPIADVRHVITGASIDVPSTTQQYRGKLRFGSASLPPGTLTQSGVDQLNAVGRDVGRRYLHTDSRFDDREVYVRSTAVNRTVQSAQSVIAGMYSSPSADSSVPVYSVSGDEEYLYPSVKPCPRLGHIYKTGRSRFNSDPSAGGVAEVSSCAAAAGVQSYNATFRERMGKYLNRNAVVATATAGVGGAGSLPSHLSADGAETEVLADTHYTLASLRSTLAAKLGVAPADVNFVQLRDLLSAQRADGQPLPTGWDEELYRAVDRAGTRQLVAFIEGDGSAADYGESLRLTSGRMLQELSLRLDQAAFAHALHLAAFGSTSGGDARLEALPADIRSMAGISTAATPRYHEVPEWATAENYSSLSDALTSQRYFPQSTAGLTLPHPSDPAPSSASVPRLCLYSAHDSTLIPLLMSLGVWDGEWSPFASNIAIELYADVPADHGFGVSSSGSGGDGGASSASGPSGVLTEGGNSSNNGNGSAGSAGSSVVPLALAAAAAGATVAADAPSSSAHKDDEKHHAGKHSLFTSSAVLEALATAASGVEDAPVEAIDAEMHRKMLEVEEYAAEKFPDSANSAHDAGSVQDGGLVGAAADTIQHVAESAEHALEKVAHKIAEAVIAVERSLVDAEHQDQHSFEHAVEVTDKVIHRVEGEVLGVASALVDAERQDQESFQHAVDKTEEVVHTTIPAVVHKAKEGVVHSIVDGVEHAVEAVFDAIAHHPAPEGDVKHHYELTAEGTPTAEEIAEDAAAAAATEPTPAAAAQHHYEFMTAEGTPAAEEIAEEDAAAAAAQPSAPQQPHHHHFELMTAEGTPAAEEIAADDAEAMAALAPAATPATSVAAAADDAAALAALELAAVLVAADQQPPAPKARRSVKASPLAPSPSQALTSADAVTATEATAALESATASSVAAGIIGSLAGESAEKLDSLLSSFVDVSGRIAEAKASAEAASHAAVSSGNKEVEVEAAALLAVADLLSADRGEIVSQISSVLGQVSASSSSAPSTVPAFQRFPHSSSPPPAAAAAEAAPAPVAAPAVAAPAIDFDAIIASERQRVEALLAEERSRAADSIRALEQSSSERVAEVIAAERRRTEELLATERERSSSALQSADASLAAIKDQLAGIEASVAARMDEGRKASEAAMSWAQDHVRDAVAAAQGASEQVTAAANAAAAAIAHARDAQDVTSRAGSAAEQAVLAQAATAAEAIAARSAADKAASSVQSARVSVEEASATAARAASDAAAAKEASESVSSHARSAAADAQMAREQAAAAVAASQEALAEARRGRADTTAAVDALKLAVGAATAAAQSARSAEESAMARAGELAVAAQRADLMSQVAGARADALAAVAAAAEAAQRAQADASKAVITAEASKARAAAEAAAAVRSSEAAKRRAEEEQRAAESIAASMRGHAEGVIAVARQGLEEALKRMRVEEDAARASADATVAAIAADINNAITDAERRTREAEALAVASAAAASDARVQAEADAALAQAVATEKAALAMAVAEAQSEAAAQRAAQAKIAAEAQARAVVAEQEVLQHRAVEETRSIVEEALLAQALAEELVAQSKRATEESQAEAARAVEEVKAAAQAARAEVEAEAQRALAAATEMAARAKSELVALTSEVAAARSQAEQAKRIAATSVENARYQAKQATKLAASVAAPVPPTAASTASGSSTETSAAALAEQLAVQVPAAAPSTATASEHGAAAAHAPSKPAQALDGYTAALSRTVLDTNAKARYEAEKAKTKAEFEESLSSILAFMHLGDTAANRERARRYAETFGLQRVLSLAEAASADQKAKAAAGSAIGGRHAGEQSYDRILPLPPRESSYVAAVSKVTTKTKPPQRAAVVLQAPSEGSAPSRSVTGSEGYLAALLKGSPKAAEAAASAAASAVPAPLEAEGFPSASSALHSSGPQVSKADAAYLAAQEAARNPQQPEEAAPAPVEAVAPAPPAPKLPDGHHGYMSHLMSAATSITRGALAKVDKALHLHDTVTPEALEASEVMSPLSSVGALESGFATPEQAYSTSAAAVAAAARAQPSSTSNDEPATASADVSSYPSDDDVYLATLLRSRSAGVTAHSPVPSASQLEQPLAPAPQYYVRVTYNGKALVLPGAAEAVSSSVQQGKRSAEFCPLPVFRALMSQYIPRDYASECGVTLVRDEATGNMMAVPIGSQGAAESGGATIDASGVSDLRQMAGAATRLGPNTVHWPVPSVLPPPESLPAEIRNPIAAAPAWIAAQGMDRTEAARDTVESASLAEVGEDVAFDTLAPDARDVKEAETRA